MSERDVYNSLKKEWVIPYGYSYEDFYEEMGSVDFLTNMEKSSFGLENRKSDYQIIKEHFKNKVMYNNYNGGGNNRYYGRSNRNYARGYQKPQKKRSGAKAGTFTTKGTSKRKSWTGIYVNAWNYSRSRGLITVSGMENSKSTKSTSKNGNRFITIMFEVFYKRTGNSFLELANYNVTTGKVYLEKLGMCISTKAPNGGFFGKIK